MDNGVHPPEVTFSYIPGDTEYDVTERYAFWYSPNTKTWFKSHGYTLYHQEGLDPSVTYSVLPFNTSGETHYPYAYHDTHSHHSEETRLRADEYSGKVAFAQDSSGRHVAIKLVRSDTDEFRILHFLSTKSMDTLKENCVIPVLDILPIEGFSFVVMPRWGPYVCVPQLNFLHEVITLMRSILKGLTFLHENGIAHHDILLRNVLVNHCSDATSLISGNETRTKLRSNRCLTYAVFDFDQSVILPPGMKKGEFRLPYHRSWGDFNGNSDTSMGEYDYDPFVFDVGMLGVEFCDRFQTMTCQFPKLAPLLDMMTTRHLHRRFTASQALQFLEEATSELSASEYAKTIGIWDSNSTYLRYDRWAGLRREFVEKWKHYMETPIPWYTAMLRQLYRRRRISSIIRWIRWVSYSMSSPFRACSSWVSYRLSPPFHTVATRIVNLPSVSRIFHLVFFRAFLA